MNHRDYIEMLVLLLEAYEETKSEKIYEFLNRVPEKDIREAERV